MSPHPIQLVVDAMLLGIAVTMMNNTYSLQKFNSLTICREEDGMVVPTSVDLNTLMRMAEQMSDKDIVALSAKVNLTKYGNRR